MDYVCMYVRVFGVNLSRGRWREEELEERREGEKGRAAFEKEREIEGQFFEWKMLLASWKEEERDDQAKEKNLGGMFRTREENESREGRSWDREDTRGVCISLFSARREIHSCGFHLILSLSLSRRDVLRLIAWIDRDRDTDRWFSTGSMCWPAFGDDGL